MDVKNESKPAEKFRFLAFAGAEADVGVVHLE